MEANRNFNKWLSLGRRISGTFWVALCMLTLTEKLDKYVLELPLSPLEI
jgi:hypothetical protein